MPLFDALTTCVACSPLICVIVIVNVHWKSSIDSQIRFPCFQGLSYSPVSAASVGAAGSSPSPSPSGASGISRPGSAGARLPAAATPPGEPPALARGSATSLPGEPTAAAAAAVARSSNTSLPPLGSQPSGIGAHWAAYAAAQPAAQLLAQLSDGGVSSWGVPTPTPSVSEVQPAVVPEKLPSPRSGALRQSQGRFATLVPPNAVQMRTVGSARVHKPVWM